MYESLHAYGSQTVRLWQSGCSPKTVGWDKGQSFSVVS